MKNDLRNDLLAIILEEAFGMLPSYARKVINGGGNPRHHQADQEAFEAAEHLVARFDARCSKIEG